MSVTATEIKVLHEMTYQVLLEWLESPPKDRRQLKALELLAEANQILYAACINLGLDEGEAS